MAAQETFSKWSHTNLWESFSEIQEEAGTSPTNFNSEVDIDNISERLLRFHRSSYYTWWADNKERFPTLSNQLSVISVLHLHPPLQSGFSLVLKRYTIKACNRLAPGRAEILLFIKNNYTLANPLVRQINIHTHESIMYTPLMMYISCNKLHQLSYGKSLSAGLHIR